MTQFQLRLVDTGSPSGELRADQLIALLRDLQAIATRIGRMETTGEQRGRLPRGTEEMVALSVSLGSGSTTLQWRRASQNSGLDFDLPHEKAFDRTFEKLMTSIANNDRPSWLNDSFAQEVGSFRGNLERTARRVEFSSNGTVHTTFNTADTSEKIWETMTVGSTTEEISFIGQLRAINLDTHRLRVTDDVGNKVSLPNVRDVIKARTFIGHYVEVTGTPQYAGDGRLTRIHNAIVMPAPPIFQQVSQGDISIEELLESAPGPDFGGVAGLTDEESEDFLKAIGV